jgi:hypothetical protein
MSAPERNSFFCFPESLNVSQDEVEFIKARLLLQFLLLFLVRFSSSDACDGVDEYECSEYMNPHLNIHNSSTCLRTSGEENRT